MTGVVVCLGEIRHDVGRTAAIGDDVVNASRLRDVLSHQVDRMVHHGHRVEGGTTFVRRRCRMSRLAVKAELGGDVRQTAGQAGSVLTPGMPGEDDVAVLEGAGSRHVDFPATAFFGRSSVEANGAGDAFYPPDNL